MKKQRGVSEMDLVLGFGFLERETRRWCLWLLKQNGEGETEERF
jgi:hypothetical protein